MFGIIGVCSFIYQGAAWATGKMEGTCNDAIFTIGEPIVYGGRSYGKPGLHFTVEEWGIYSAYVAINQSVGSGTSISDVSAYLSRVEPIENILARAEARALG